MTNGILRQKDVQAATGLSRTTIWRLVRHGAFPAPRRLTNGLPGKVAVGWLARDVEGWLATRPMASEPGPGGRCATCAELSDLRVSPEGERLNAEIEADLAWVASTHPARR